MSRGSTKASAKPRADASEAFTRRVISEAMTASNALGGGPLTKKKYVSGSSVGNLSGARACIIYLPVTALPRCRDLSPGK